MRTIPGLLLCGAFLASNEVEAKVDVVATVPDLAALAKAVGGDQIRLTTLSTPTEDPRLVVPGPSLVVALDRADLLIAVGLELETRWLPRLQTAARNPRIKAGGAAFLECAPFVAAHDLALEHDPHYLFDPRQAVPCARAIAGKLAQLDPDHAGAYEANGRQFTTALDLAIQRWEADIAGLRGRPVVFHRAWSHVMRWVGLEGVAELGQRPGHLADVLARARDAGARLVLQEPFDPGDTARRIADRLDGGEVLVLPGGTDVGAGETYVEHIDRMVGALVAASR